MSGTDDVWLVGDIGGTHLRLALARRGLDGQPLLAHEQVLRVAQCDSLAGAARRWLAQVRTPVRGALFAVAGRVVDGCARMTNLPWEVSAAAVANELALAQVRVINDLGAAAAAIPALTHTDAPLLWPSAVSASATDTARVRRCVVLGAGTGLGIAGALIDGMRVRVLDTEGGHAGYAPATPQEDALAAALRARLGRVSWESVASGPGLLNVYRALPHGTDEGLCDSPEQIVAAGRAGTDPRAALALELMCQALAAAAGDCVLFQGAWDGVYLLGSLLQELRPLLESNNFQSRFKAKGPFCAAMSVVPVRLVTRSQPVLFGAACLALAS